MKIDSATLLLAAVASLLGLLSLPGPFVWMGSIGGLIALLVLFAFDQEGYRTPLQSLAFSAVCGFSAALGLAAVYHFLSDSGEIHLANGHWMTVYVPITWLFATAAFWAIDLMRVSARKVVPIQVPRALGETSVLGGVSVPMPAVYTPPARTAPSYQPPAPSYQPPAPSYQPPAPSYQVPTPSYQPAPVSYEPPPVRMQEPVDESFPAVPPVEFPTAEKIFPVPQSLAIAPEPPAAAPLPAAEAHATPQPLVSQSGKEAMIYVSLLGEGLNVMRSVRAEPLGHDFYRILDEMPEGETWQFQTGQVVKCKKKNLSSGKAMVAVEEAPRAS